jgi:hypothetical protein
MKARLTLRRPTHWQDFESLCKKLWGEIWDCPSIKLNGRSGDTQHGVDIYGIPKGEMQYFGIQCKGKDEYTNKQYTETEITEEIEKAKSFKPPLKEFYLTTTAVKNAEIEAFVRQKNIEHINSGLFKIEIFSWEDIVDLIDENKTTYDYYVNSNNYKNQQSVSVTFQDGSTEITCKPYFKQNVTIYRQVSKELEHFLIINKKRSTFTPYESIYDRIHANQPDIYKIKTNHSYFEIAIRIQNTGKDTIEDYKVHLEFNGEILDISDTNRCGMLTNISTYVPTVHINTENSAAVVIVPKDKVLVSEDYFTSDSIFVKTNPEITTIKIVWKLLSKNFKDEGNLIINVQPIFLSADKNVIVKEESQVRTVEGTIDEYITED